MTQRLHCPRCGELTSERESDGRVRPVCDACGQVVYLDPKLAVAVVIERAGRILLGRRGANTRSPGRWSFPAGFVDRGEAVESAAIREVREETGLHVESLTLLGLFSRDGEPVVLAAYAARGASGDPVAGDDLDELAWFSPDDLPELAFPHDPEIVALWRRAHPHNAEKGRKRADT